MALDTRYTLQASPVYDVVGVKVCQCLEQQVAVSSMF
jgi:hypothetical protein